MEKELILIWMKEEEELLIGILEEEIYLLHITSELAQIRSQFSAFSQHKLDTNGDGQVNSSDESDFDRITTTDGIVYSFLRPWKDSNGLTVANFSSTSKTVTMNLTNC